MFKPLLSNFLVIATVQWGVYRKHGSMLPNTRLPKFCTLFWFFAFSFSPPANLPHPGQSPKWRLTTLTSCQIISPAKIERKTSCGYNKTIKIPQEDKVSFHSVLVKNCSQHWLEIIGGKLKPNITWNNGQLLNYSFQRCKKSHSTSVCLVVSSFMGDHISLWSRLKLNKTKFNHVDSKRWILHFNLNQFGCIWKQPWARLIRRAQRSLHKTDDKPVPVVKNG